MFAVVGGGGAGGAVVVCFEAVRRVSLRPLPKGVRIPHRREVQRHWPRPLMELDALLLTVIQALPQPSGIYPSARDGVLNVRTREDASHHTSLDAILRS